MVSGPTPTKSKGVEAGTIQGVIQTVLGVYETFNRRLWGVSAPLPHAGQTQHGVTLPGHHCNEGPCNGSRRHRNQATNVMLGSGFVGRRKAGVWHSVSLNALSSVCLPPRDFLSTENAVNAAGSYPSMMGIMSRAYPFVFSRVFFIKMRRYCIYLALVVC